MFSEHMELADEGTIDLYLEDDNERLVLEFGGGLHLILYPDECLELAAACIAAARELAKVRETNSRHLS